MIQFKDIPVNSIPDFREWKLGWTAEDRRQYSPRQQNDDVYGVFPPFYLPTLQGRSNLKIYI